MTVPIVTANSRNLADANWKLFQLVRASEVEVEMPRWRHVGLTPGCGGAGKRAATELQDRCMSSKVGLGLNRCHDTSCPDQRCDHGCGTLTTAELNLSYFAISIFATSFGSHWERLVDALFLASRVFCQPRVSGRTSNRIHIIRSYARASSYKSHVGFGEHIRH